MSGRVIIIEREIIIRATSTVELSDDETVEQCIKAVEEYETDCQTDRCTSAFEWQINEESVTYREWAGIIMSEMPKTLQLFIECMAGDPSVSADGMPGGFCGLQINGHGVYRWYHVPKDYYPKLQRHCRSTKKQAHPVRGQVWEHLKSGHLYRIIEGYVIQESNLDPLVVYFDPDTRKMWARPLDKFMQRFKRFETK